MARLGHPTYGKSLASRFLPTNFAAEERNYGEQTAEIIDEEERRIMDEAYRRVEQILTRRRKELGQIATELIRKETLDRDELEKLLVSQPSSRTPTAVA